MQMPEPPSNKEQKRKPFPWVLWTVVSIVIIAIIVFAIVVVLILRRQNATQSDITLAIISSIATVVVGLLGLLISFLQWHHPKLSAAPEPSKATNMIIAASSKIDWGEAPNAERLYGREQELGELASWVVNDRCRVVAVLGTGGIGKTALAARLVEQVKDKFAYVLWRELKNAPPLKGILKNCVQFFSDQQRIDLPADVDGQIAILLKYLREHRCLLVLDNMETILRASNRAGQYRKGYEGYGRLIQLVGEGKHQSCLLLTSREKPKVIANLEGEALPVRSCRIEGLRPSDGREILRVKELHGSEEIRNALVDRYIGNPLALKLVSQYIREVFDGDIAGFLKSGRLIFSDIREVLDQQFERLSELEQETMYWLAIEREAVPLDGLQENIIRPVSKEELKEELREALRSLQRRYLVEKSATGVTLQNVIMEYVTDRLVDQVCEEIANEKLALFTSHPLVKAQAKDYVRKSQERLILAPVAQRLLGIFGKENSQKKLKNILANLREAHPQESNYAVGNILNLLVQLGCDFGGYDFSHLVIRQAYLQGVALHDVNFMHADLKTSVFTDTFGGILSVAFSPDSKLLAGGTASGEIRLWNVADGTPFCTCPGRSGSVRSVSFSPNGRIIASGSDDQVVRLWNASTGQCLKTLRGHHGLLQSTAFSPDGSLLASCGGDQAVLLWDVNTGEGLKALRGHSSWVGSVSFSPNEGIIASGSGDKTIRLWDVSTGQCLNTLQGHSGGVRSIAFSPDGSLIASGGDDQTMRLWDVRTGDCLKIVQEHTHWVRSIDFSPDGSLIASGSDDQTVRLWDVSTVRCLKILQGYSSWVGTIDFSPDGSLIASGSDDQTVRLWDVNTGHCLKTLQGYGSWVGTVAFSPDGSLIANGSNDQTVRLWDVRTGESLKTLRGHTNWVGSVAFSPDGRTIASGSDDRTIRLWNTSTGECLKILQGYKSWVGSVVFSPNGKIIASGSDDQTVELWDVSTGRSLKTLHGHNDWVGSVSFSPNGRTIASGSDDQTVRLWDVSTGRCLNILGGHSGWVGTVAFSPDGTLIVSSGSDQTVRLWDVSTGECLNILRGHNALVMSVSFSPDGKVFASGSGDQTVRLWDVSTGQCVNILRGHSGGIQSIAFSPNGRTIVSNSNDGTVKLWDVQMGGCVKTLMSDRLYERMNITGVIGLTEAQKATLKALGAVEE